MRNPKTMFMQRQERAMDGDNWLTLDLLNAIQAGEVAYDAGRGMFFDPLHADLTIEDFSQRKLAKLVRDGRIVVEGVTVRLAKGERPDVT